MGDWFPLGAIASRRYALLNRVPLLPHEELLCKEAMLLYASLELEDSDFPSEDSLSDNGIRISFVNLMRFQHCARWLLLKSRACLSISSHSHGTILCSLCKRDCYVAYVDCDCHMHPVCLRHDIESLDFTCGSKHTLYLREDVSDMEATAKRFEQEDGILDEILKQTKSDKNMYSYPLSNMFQMAEANGYTPYCEMKIDFVTDFYTTPEQSRNNQECFENLKPVVSKVSFSSAASARCSLSEPLETSAPKNEDEGHANFNLGITDFGKICERISNGASESLLSPAQYPKSSSKSKCDLHRLDMKPIVDNESDDSDSGVFRVKRPSSLKAERRNMNDAMSLNHSAQKGLKRLKQVLHTGRSVQPIDFSRAHESSYKYSHLVNHKVNGDISLGDRFARGNSIPISLRYKKLSNEEVSRQRDRHRRDRLQQTDGEPPPKEVGPKRLKVRSPSLMGLESRLN